jgi:hypothetical protein
VSGGATVSVKRRAVEPVNKVKKHSVDAILGHALTFSVIWEVAYVHGQYEERFRPVLRSSIFFLIYRMVLLYQSPGNDECGAIGEKIIDRGKKRKRAPNSVHRKSHMARGIELGAPR